MFRRHADFGFELKIGSFTRQLIERVLTFPSWHCPVTKDYQSQRLLWPKTIGAIIKLGLKHLQSHLTWLTL